MCLNIQRVLMINSNVLNYAYYSDFKSLLDEFKRNFKLIHFETYSLIFSDLVTFNDL